MSAFSVRPFTCSDAAFVSELEKECFSSPMTEDYINAIQSKKELRFFVAHDENGNPVGFVGMSSILDEGSIVSIAVAGENRNSGVGRMLMEAAETEGERLNLSFITLEVRAGNAAAIRLYEKSGYKTCGLMKNYYSFPKEDAIIMTRFLK